MAKHPTSEKRIKETRRYVKKDGSINEVEGDVLPMLAKDKLVKAYKEKKMKDVNMFYSDGENKIVQRKK